MSIEVDTRAFDKLVAGLAAASGAPMKETAMWAVGRLMNECIKLTKAASREKIVTTALARNRTVDTDRHRLYTAKAGKTWLTVKRPKVKHLDLSLKVSDEQWSVAQTLTQKRLASQINPSVAARSRGMMKRSWVDLAEAIGSEAVAMIKAPAWVRKAQSYSGNAVPQMASADVVANDKEVTIRGENLNRLLKTLQHPGYNGREILGKAIRRMDSSLKRDLKKGLLDDIEKQTRFYKGLFKR